ASRPRRRATPASSPASCRARASTRSSTRSRKPSSRRPPWRSARPSTASTARWSWMPRARSPSRSPPSTSSSPRAPGSARNRIRGREMSWHSRTLGQFLSQHARERGEVEALVTQSSRLSYKDLYGRARDVAGALQAMGLGRGDHVGILMGNDEKWLSLFYGAALVGAVTVPVNTRFKTAEIDFCLKQSGCKALFYVGQFLKIDFESMLSGIKPPIAVDVAPGLPKGTWTEQEGAVRPDDPLLIQFTSGTTAYPKGVVLTHDNMLRDAYMAGARIGVRPEDRYFNCRPFFHAAGSTLSALMALTHGCTLVTLPTFEAGAALEMMERERCTLVSGNDTLFQMMMGHADFPRRRLCLRGGWAAAGPQTMRQIIDVLGAAEICAAYGLSEASPNCAMSDWRDPEEPRVNGLARPLEG